MRSVVRRALRDSLRQVRHVAVVDPGSARGTVAEVYAQVERDFGVLAPPLALHSPSPEPLAASWLLLRETLLAGGRVGRPVKEAVATAVSEANSCPYCVDVHRAKRETLSPAAGDGETRVADWARNSGRRHRGDRVPRPDPPPFSASEAPELCGVVVAFHYLNRMVSVFLADSPVPDRAPGFLRDTILRTVARTMTPVSPGPLPPGASLGLLPAAELPAGLEWAEGNPAVAGALARSSAAVERAARWVPEPVRERLRSRLRTWNGAPPGPGRAWLGEALAPLPPEDRAAARIALVTAFAPYQLLDTDVTAFRDRYPADRQLIEVTAWAALTTAGSIGSGLVSFRPAAGR